MKMPMKFEAKPDDVGQETKSKAPESSESVSVIEKALAKQYDVLKYGTAHTSLFPTLRALNMDEYFLRNRIGFFESRYKYDDNQERDTRFVEVTPENIREYLNQSAFDDSIQDVLLYGIQSASRPGSQKIKKGNTAGGYDTDKIAKTARDYERKIEEARDQQQNVYYNLIGRDTTKRYRLGVPDSWEVYKDDVKNHFENSWSRGGVSVVFEPPHISKEEEPNSNEQKVKMGHFRLNRSSDNGIDKFWEEIKKKYPDIKPGDPRILEWFSLQGQEIERLKKQDFEELRSRSSNRSFFSDKFNEHGHTLASSEWGFKLRLRVPTRKIKGLVINFDQDSSERTPDNSVINEDIVGDVSQMGNQELFDSFKATLETLTTHSPHWKENHYNNILKRLITIMERVGKIDSEKVVPIYNYKGDMLWPVTMSHDELAKTAVKPE